MLQFLNIIKRYGSFTAFNIPHFIIDDGIVWLQGENGSGKTTLLKIIAGILPFEGDIIINKQFSIKRQRLPYVRLINYAETEPQYPGFLTAKEMVQLYCHAKKGDIKEAEKILESLHIFDAYKKPLATWSSGMIKKLSIGLAMIGKPKWILLDEPLVTADVASVEIICSLIKEKFINEGISFLITSHQVFYSGQLSFISSLLMKDHVISKTTI